MDFITDFPEFNSNTYLLIIKNRLNKAVILEFILLINIKIYVKKFINYFIKYYR